MACAATGESGRTELGRRAYLARDTFRAAAAVRLSRPPHTRRVPYSSGNRRGAAGSVRTSEKQETFLLTLDKEAFRKHEWSGMIGHGKAI